MVKVGEQECAQSKAWACLLATARTEKVVVHCDGYCFVTMTSWWGRSSYPAARRGVIVNTKSLCGSHALSEADECIDQKIGYVAPQTNWQATFGPGVGTHLDTQVKSFHLVQISGENYQSTFIREMYRFRLPLVVSTFSCCLLLRRANGGELSDAFGQSSSPYHEDICLGKG